MNETEKDLVEKALAGRNGAFEALVLPYRRLLLGLAFRMTGNWEDAKEIAQEALFRAYRSLSRFDTSRSFRNWFFQIAINQGRDRGRMKKREALMLGSRDAGTITTPDPESSRRSEEFRSDLMMCLPVLTSREREVFILRDIEDLNIKETADVLGCSSVSVRVNLSSARRKLRAAIRDRCPHLEEKS